MRGISVLGLGFWLSACGGGLPDDFLFGTAVAGFQIEMGCPTLAPEACEDRRSDWYEFITSTTAVARSGNFLSGEAPSRGPGYYELYPQDLARAAELGTNAFRFSVEWSRVFPESTVGIDDPAALAAMAGPALAYYRAQLDALAAKGIRPLVTLHHYTLPVWLHDAVGCNSDLDRCTRRGWLDEAIVPEIAKYAGFVAAALGDKVDLWATENEPFAVVLPGYLFPSETRTNPPAVLGRFAEGKRAMLNMIQAHARMYDAIHAADTADADGDGRAARVGVVYAYAPVAPKDPSSSVDRLGAANVEYLYNKAFLNAVVLGVLDDDLDGRGEARPELVGRSDYLGVNYYTRVVLAGDRDSIAPDFSPLATFNPLSIEQGAPYARGLYESLLAVKETYPGVPILITENGADASGGDTTGFLVEHVQWMLRAIDEGAPVEGYFWWSLFDNYEWNHGMALRFGMFAVDGDDPMKTRVRRPVADAYARIIEERGVPAELAEAHPIGE